MNSIFLICFILIILSIIIVISNQKKYTKEIYSDCDGVINIVTKKLKEKYKVIDLSDNDYKNDISNFLAYDAGIETIRTEPLDEYPVQSNSINVFETTDNRKFAFFASKINTLQYKYQDKNSDINTDIEIGIVFESKYLNKRIHLSTFKMWDLQKQTDINGIYDDTELVIKYDQNNINAFSKKINNNYNGKSFEHEPYFEKLEFTDTQKNILNEIGENSKKLESVLALENGVGRLRIIISKSEFEKRRKDDEISAEQEYGNTAVEIIEKILKEF